MSETAGVYGSASTTTGAFGSAYTTSGPYDTPAPMTAEELARCEAARWNEVGRAVGEVVRRIPDWFRLPPAVEQHFQTACLEQLRGVRAMIDYQIGIVARATTPRPSGARISVE